MTISFNRIRTEGEGYGVTFLQRTDHHGRVNGYTVERVSDGVKASMLHGGGRMWRGAFGEDHAEGTKAIVANWALDKVANADKHSGSQVITTAGQRKILAVQMPGLRNLSTQWRNIAVASAGDAGALILRSAMAYRDVAAQLGLMNYATELSVRIRKYAQEQDHSLLGQMNNLLSGLDNILVSEHLLDADKN